VLQQVREATAVRRVSVAAWVRHARCQVSLEDFKLASGGDYHSIARLR
jgi:hypothetical protein